MAAELSKSLDVDAKLCADGKGIFDVLVDGDLVYSKYETNRFPKPGEVTKLIGSN
ncbi:MAG: hypothetical protein CMQ19_01300 [Gammaproteobacteria bacterium]|nr:hypothetical protein [Gammaproteobacteria bacterium]